MPTSVMDPEVQTVFDRAADPQTRKVKVGIGVSK